MNPLQEHQWSLATLSRCYPPTFHHLHKRRIHAMLPPGPGDPSRRIRVTRWGSLDLPGDEVTVALPRATVHSGPFDYPPAPTGVRVWTPNFAHPDLLAFWDGPLLAQDELQALEHPALGSVRQALLAEGASTATVDTDGQGTPFLLEGAPRHCALDLDPSPHAPKGLYGNRFQGASWDAVQHAVQVLDPPTHSDLYALTAPYGGRGVYTTLQIRHILKTAYTAFAALVHRSEGAVTQVHTGLWGCGAFGGDPLLMLLCQWIAAGWAQVDQVVLHVSERHQRTMDRVKKAHAELAPRGATRTPGAWMIPLARLHRRWGVSDGN